MNDFKVTAFMEQLYDDAMAAVEEPLSAIKDWENYKKAQTGIIRDVLKLDVLEKRYAIEASWELMEDNVKAGMRIRKYTIRVAENLNMAVYVLSEPSAIPTKAIMTLNGHGTLGAKEIYASGEKSFGSELVKMGYLVVAPELFGYGEAKADGYSDDCDACESCGYLEPRLIHMGYNLLGLRVWEAMKALDFARKEFGIDTFAVFGASGGGQVCNYVGVLDERIDRMIVAAYPNLYKYSILAIRHCICNYVPDQMKAGESFYVTSLAAPEKKLLVINGDKDPIFPKQGSDIAFEYLEKVYKKLGAQENYTSEFFDGGHGICIPKMCEWLKKTENKG